ncbi:MAG: acyltransferase [Synechococcaceae cyanobacterium RL_1_2]|nr:acyltransferase [Synechococcaceae cyanobacterium RL_1_2]
MLTNPLLLEFGFGILIFYFHKRTKFNHYHGLCAVLIAVVMMVMVNNLNLDYSRVIKYGIPGFFFFLGMVLLEPSFKPRQSNLGLQLLQKIGDSSYSLYLCHPFTLVAVSIVLSKLGLSKFGYSFVFLLVISSIAVGYGCYVWLEQPLMKFIKRRQKLPAT